jgi:hypothetical protein
VNREETIRAAYEVALQMPGCDDCHADTELIASDDGTPRGIAIHHDSTCPAMAERERNAEYSGERTVHIVDGDNHEESE